MRGLMMDRQLTITSILERARTLFSHRPIVTRTAGGAFRYTYGDLARRTAQLANALGRLGVEAGDRVGTFAWNTHRHLELYLGVPSTGAVLHTVNIRLFPERIEELRAAGISVSVLFLSATTDVILRRYSETRRKHPLTDSETSLAEAVEQVGDITFLDRSSGLLQVIARHAPGPWCYLTFSLQGRASGTEIFTSIEPIDASPPPPIGPILERLADELRIAVW